MKKALWVVLAAAIISFIVWSNNPLDEMANFIIGGQVPGTKIVLSFWPSLGIVLVFLIGLKRGLSNLRLQMLRKKSKDILKENAASEFRQTNDGSIEFSSKNRSVIAAPTKVSLE